MTKQRKKEKPKWELVSVGHSGPELARELAILRNRERKRRGSSG